jgi:glycosyltransferase involved in cell wall biosynthesis
LLCVSPEAALANSRIRAGRPIAGALGAVDLQRFATSEDERRAARLRVRKEFGCEPDQPLLGVVARVQPHRRFDLLFAAFRRLVDRGSRARLVILGRGTRLDEVARRPVAELGLEQSVVFAGYRDAGYVDTLRALDCLTFLVPGSDGTCRAVLEAAACGVPCVASRRGALPEIVEHEQTGLLIDELPESLVAAWEQMLADDGRRERYSARAAAAAPSRFSPDRLAAEVEQLYRAALALREFES